MSPEERKDIIPYIRGCRPAVPAITCLSMTEPVPLWTERFWNGAWKRYGSAAPARRGMPVKDTVKIVDEEGFVIQTPDRSRVWNVQTPQIFRFPLVLEAYQKALAGDCSKITDDAMVVERYGNHPVKLYEGSYYNIKITTPETW